MLGKVKRYINKQKKSDISIEEKIAQYMLDMQEQTIQYEWEYISKHNKLDLLNLDKWIQLEYEKVIEYDLI